MDTRYFIYPWSKTIDLTKKYQYNLHGIYNLGPILYAINTICGDYFAALSTFVAQFLWLPCCCCSLWDANARLHHFSLWMSQIRDLFFPCCHHVVRVPPRSRCETVQNTRCVCLHHHLADWSHVVISGLTPCVGHKRAWPVRICPFFLLFSFLYEKPYCLLCEDWRWLAPLKAKLTIKTRICCFSGWVKGKLRESM